jgi:hypothetical protein
VPSKRHHRNSTKRHSDASPEGQLDGIRARVAVLCQRIKERRDPEAIRAVQTELSRVGQVLGKNGREGGHG